MSGLLAVLILVGVQGDRTNPAFERLKKLAGDWEMKGIEGVAVRYRVTAAGSAVLETLFPGTDHEMVTLYTRDGDRLKLTHYCALGNQPTMREEKSDEKSIRWVCDGKVGGAKSHEDPHMHTLAMTFVDEDHLRNEVTSFGKGENEKLKTFEFSRKK